MGTKGEDLNIRVEPLNKAVEGPKRTHLPLKITWTCPTCGSYSEVDLVDDTYLSYPDFGGVARMYFVCDQCCEANVADGGRRKCDFSARFKLTVNLEVDDG